MNGSTHHRMHLVVFSHKLCWPSSRSACGYATDGGFPMQMRALSELFDETTLVVPVAAVASTGNTAGELPLAGRNLKVVPLSNPTGQDWRRKLSMLPWLLTNGATIWRQTRRADAVHAPIPGDVGTLGMLGAYLLGKPLFVRYCGNWLATHTAAERFWKWFMERVAGGRNVMLATGGDSETPSAQNPAVQWIFSTSLTSEEIEAVGQPRQLDAGKSPRLIIVARQERGKGTEIVIEAMRELLADFPALQLDVVGDGGALADLKRLAAELGIADHVAFHGKVNHEAVLRLLRQADLFCYPTDSEGFPKVVLEALATGLPVITTKVSILPQLIGQGGGQEAGMLLDEATPAQLVEAVRRCLADGARYHQMSASAVATARGYTLESWRDTIGQHLQTAWGQLGEAGGKLNG